MAEKKPITFLQAKNLMRQKADEHEAFALLADVFDGAEIEERTKAETDIKVAALKREVSDMQFTLDNQQREFTAEQTRMEGERGEATEKTKAHVAKTTRETVDATQGHDARVKAMVDNESKLKGEFEDAAQERRETLAGLNRQIRDAEGTIAALKAGLPG